MSRRRPRSLARYSPTRHTTVQTPLVDSTRTNMNGRAWAEVWHCGAARTKEVVAVAVASGGWWVVAAITGTAATKEGGMERREGVQGRRGERGEAKVGRRKGERVLLGDV